MLYFFSFVCYNPFWAGMWARIGVAMKKCTVGGQAVMEGVMMKSPTGIAMAVRDGSGRIVLDYKPFTSKAKKGSILGWPVIRGVVAFVESLSTGMSTLTKSAEMIGEEVDEEPSKFELWLAKTFDKSVEKIIVGIAVIIAIALSIGLFFLLPQLISSLIFRGSEAAGIVKSLTEGMVRLLIFLGYILFCAQIKDIRRVFMYHGAEHKTIACYEAEDELTPANALKYSRLHPRCGTNYLFLVMAGGNCVFRHDRLAGQFYGAFCHPVDLLAGGGGPQL